MPPAEKLHDVMQFWLAPGDRTSRQLGSLRTGFRRFDHAIGGVERGELVVVAARPSIGLTLFLMQMARALAEGARVLLASRCLKPEEVAPWLLAIESGVPFSRVRKREFVARAEVPFLEEARLALARGDLWVLGGMLPEEVFQHWDSTGGEGPAVVLYDSVRLHERRPMFDVSGKELREILRDSKALAAKHGVAAVVGVTLTRESTYVEPSHLPTHLDLGEAATIADTLVFLDRPSFYEPSLAPPPATVSEALSVMFPRSIRGSNQPLSFDFEQKVPRFRFE